ncbi:hypothetical protein G7B40_039205 [Aetokthonos hydrillicola Thurmond2011]|jgi:DNA repair exonuclease SbcCD ATPase subunit|uniref:Uncharacterized protein n=2 Tax=Aetokthonos TaxID=1550243 RepID=A0AAP5M9U8_9CYAN|nr:hypothetical protein [Aetokthonos hydrillicola]MDR9900531.1 hypothetical protein [Aetokthonos hydrillicola Thurmond2011]
MNESSLKIFLFFTLAGLLGIAGLTENRQSLSIAQAQFPIAKVSPEPEKNLRREPSTQPESSVRSVESNQHTLRMSLVVDNPSFLKVNVGQEITAGEVISDNTIERDRLTKHRQSIELQIQNLKSKFIHKPTEPNFPLALRALPPANYSEEESLVKNARMKLSQARSMLEARTPFLTKDNPEKLASIQRAKSLLDQKSIDVERQERLIKFLGENKQNQEASQAILDHEQARLRKLESEKQEAQAALETEKGKLSTDGVENQQKLEQLQLAVHLAESELNIAESKLSSAQSRRKMQEFDAATKEVEKQQKNTQLKQEYERQQQTYNQEIRERDYQIAQLQLSLVAVDDKLSLIPVVKSPRNGYVRRIKPWVGKNGKYETTLVISSTPPNKSSDSGSSSED